MSFIDDVITYAQSQQTSHSESFYNYVRYYLSNLSLEDLETYSLVDLYGLVLTQWQQMQQFQSGSISLRVYNPTIEDDGWQSSHTIVQLVMDDRPFLIDSMRMEFNRLGLTTHQMIFMGGLQLRRDDSGKISHIHAPTDRCEADCRIAPIHMEIDRQNNPDVLESIYLELMRVLGDVRQVVMDWPKMCEQLRDIISEYDSKSLQQKLPDMLESRKFLSWLLADHFTLLGYRDYKLVGKGNNRALRLIPGSGLGVLHDEARSKQTRQYADLPEEARRVALSTEQCLIITKTNTRSTVHRPAYTDYIGIKKFDEHGQLIGERRLIGLYTSLAYSSNPEEIPFLRQKVRQVMDRSGLPLRSHAGKDLLHILATFPRDDLFHASIDEIYQMSIGILRLQERRRIRVFARRDIYNRFVSCLVFIPRENFSTKLVDKMRAVLAKEMQSSEVMLNTRFSESVLARVHFIVKTNPDKPIDVDFKVVEKKLIAVGQSWLDGMMLQLKKQYGEERACELMGKYRDAFSAGYQDVFTSADAVHDLEKIERIVHGSSLQLSFYHKSSAQSHRVHLKLYNRDETIPLSDAVPMLENMGFRVLGEESFHVTINGDDVFWINDFSLAYNGEGEFDSTAIDRIFYDAFKSVWYGGAENDGFNQLVIASRLNWHEISMLRAYAKYFRQIGFNLSQQYIEQALVNNPTLASFLVAYFKYRFDPSFGEGRAEEMQQIESQFLKCLDDVISLDEDRILRFYMSAIQATIRTNFFQVDQSNLAKSYLSLKFDSKKIPDMPLPVPAYEVFVYSPQFEGIHLRSSRVARGGIRWSDRREDFRVEVLGLMKAQQVKNSVIVPSGAKGGFVTKSLNANLTREQQLEFGIRCYQNYIRGLLDITDNLKQGMVIKPESVVCYDGDDSYMVVAADKGTATFSDIANKISVDYDYWLQDAFASGGCTGYDHKKMAITARGAWVSVQRHFLEQGVNPDKDTIRVVGIGDMAGDVFGNGMLLSKELKLIAAFNHLHIFVDPDPDPHTSYLERKRLFELPRSSWEDYNPALISQGGGVYSRSAKAIRLSEPAKQALGIDKDVVVPNELLRAILTAEVDLLWNGGIGTFVKSRTEENAMVGDRTNDNIRINGEELRVRVVGEGGNLGMTQLGRVEYDLNGGRCNSDFIDNSAGVDCSDHEVNLKILLSDVIAKGDLSLKQRNNLLAKLSDEVADLVLQNNYHQNQAISIASLKSHLNIGLYARFIDHYVEQGWLDRDLEYLPDNKTLQERKAQGIGLSRPELAVLFSYSKNVLKAELLKSNLYQDPFLANYVKRAFPSLVVEKYDEFLEHHHLYREIIATQISNDIVADMGITFVYQMQDETAAPVSAIVRAWACAKTIFNVRESHQHIESLDYKVDTCVQYEMILQGMGLLRRATRWILRNRRNKIDVQSTIDYFAKRVTGLYSRLPKLLVGSDRLAFEDNKNNFMDQGAPELTAARVASAAPMFHALNIIEAACVSDNEIYRVAKIYFMLVERLGLLSVRDCINAYPVDSHWSVLARAAFKADLDWVQREMAVGVLRLNTSARSIPGRINAWMDRHESHIARIKAVISDLCSAEVPDFAILSVVIRELMDLAQVGMHQRATDCTESE